MRKAAEPRSSPITVGVKRKPQSEESLDEGMNRLRPKTNRPERTFHGLEDDSRMGKKRRGRVVRGILFGEGYEAGSSRSGEKEGCINYLVKNV